MADIIRRGEKTEIVESENIDSGKIKALSDPTRIKILELLAEKPSYPSAVSKKLGIEKQKTYYHFKKLEDSRLIKESHQEKKSGGLATYYEPTASAFTLDLGGKGEPIKIPSTNPEVSRFLDPVVKDQEFNGKIVVGSPDQHGPDQVRARDGHLASEIAFKLGEYCVNTGDAVALDTELFRDSSFDHNLVLLGGVLTNTATKKFNTAFPAHFSGEDFPYREISTPNASYSDASIGIVAKAEHPNNPEKAVYLVAGIRNAGTEAAVRAFKNLEDIIEDYEKGEHYTVVRGLDMDGDGEIDDYEVIE